MRTLQLFALLIIMTSLSCQELQDVLCDHDITVTEDYFLDFDTASIDYAVPDSTDMLHITTTQEVESSIRFRPIEPDYHGYYYQAQNWPATSDSIALIGSLYFTQDNDTEFITDQFALEFIITESLDHLVLQPDSTYIYNSLELLANRLNQDDWANMDWFSNRALSDFVMTLPQIDDPTPYWGMELLCSNGFYFPNEQLTFTEVNYNANTDQIELSGEFSVDLKVLSCGFYSFFGVKNATFNVLIQ